LRVVGLKRLGVGGGWRAKRGSGLGLRFAEVCRLKRLGFFLGFGGGGLTKAAGDIDEGDKIGGDWGASPPPEDKLRARPLALRGFLGDGEVIGLSYVKGER
jgi:hypothetical protein